MFKVIAVLFLTFFGGIPSEATEMRRIALMLPLSGPYAAIGERLLSSFAMVYYGLHPSMAIDVYDTQGTPQGAKEAVQKMIERPTKPSFIIGPLLSPEITAIVPITQKHGLPLLSLSNDETVAAPLVYVFGISPRQQVLMGEGFLKRQGFSRLLLILRQGSSYAEAFLRAVRHILTRFHVTVVLMPPHAKKLTSHQLASLRGKSFDVVWAPGLDRDILALGPQLTLLFPHKKPMFLSSDDWYHKDYLQNPLLKNSWFLGPDPVKRERVVQTFHRIFHRAPTAAELLMADAANLLLSIFMKHDDVKAYGILARSEGFDGLHGQTIFTPAGHVERRAPILQVAGQGLVRVYALPFRFS